MENKVFLIGAKRSPIGKYLGSLKDVHPVELGRKVLTELLEKTKVPVDKVSEVIVGNILSAGLGQGIARQISVKSGIPESVPAYSLNMVCGSGMKAIMNGFSCIRSGFDEIVVAGGVESMSQAPFLVSGKIRDGVKMGDFSLIDHMINDSLTDAFGNMHMGITAENVAERYGIIREKQDYFSLASQQKAIEAIDSGRFDEEIIPIEIKVKKETIVFDKDEYPNRSTNTEKMAKLRPAFKDNGTVTAGNASGINDGASFTIIASEKAVTENNLPVMAEIIAVGQGGVDPAYMGMGPVPAIENALKMAGMDLSEIGLIELNEAFAAQSLAVIGELSKRYKMNEEKIMDITNVNGGAIALGHPVGASGNRIVVTLIHEMIKRDIEYGLASLCIGGGMGTAIILKRNRKG